MRKKNIIKISLFISFFLAILLIVAYSKTESKNEYSPRILNTYPHDKDAFTQGLAFDNGYLYESTGLHGKSSIRKVNIDSGTVLMKKDLPRQFFGEGITILNDKIYQITWKAKTGFIYDKESFNYLGSFNYQTEGWGITQDGKNLILSDGSSNLYFLNPSNFQTIQTLSIKTKDGKSVRYLNELEYIDGRIYSNIWQTDMVAIINPKTGVTENFVDLSILKKELNTKKIDVLNGIAYNPQSKTIYFTGKLWPKLFEVQLIEAK